MLRQDVDAQTSKSQRAEQASVLGTTVSSCRFWKIFIGKSVQNTNFKKTQSFETVIQGVFLTKIRSNLKTKRWSFYNRMLVLNGCFNWMIPNLYMGNGWK